MSDKAVWRELHVWMRCKKVGRSVAAAVQLVQLKVDISVVGAEHLLQNYPHACSTADQKPFSRHLAPEIWAELRPGNESAEDVTHFELRGTRRKLRPSTAELSDTREFDRYEEVNSLVVHRYLQTSCSVGYKMMGFARRSCVTVAALLHLPISPFFLSLSGATDYRADVVNASVHGMPKQGGIAWIGVMKTRVNEQVKS